MSYSKKYDDIIKQHIMRAANRIENPLDRAELLRSKSELFSRDEILESTLNYFKKKNENIQKVDLKDKRWANLVKIKEWDKVYFLSLNKFMIKDDVWNLETSAGPYFYTAKYIRFKGADEMTVSVAAQEIPASIYYWVGIK